MKTIIRITKSVVRMFIISLVSFGICAIVALTILYIFGPSDATLRFGASTLLFGTIIVALMLGAFDD